ncbi:MAG: hypothetical protein ACK5HP_00320 [Bacilli bacterium]
MDIVDEIKKSLDENKNLTPDVKTDIFELSILFHNKYPEVSLEKLTNNLKTLQIIKSNKFINKRVSKYNFKENVLEFNIDEINKEYDMKHVLMAELLEVITNNGEQTGFNLNDKFIALQVGYKEIITNNLVGNNGDFIPNEDEYVSANLILMLIGEEVIFNSFFKNDTKTITEALLKGGMII